MEDKDDLVNIGDQGITENEKTLSTSEVNDIVKREKARAAEKVRREMKAEHDEEIERLKSSAGKSSHSFDIQEIKKNVKAELMSDFEAEQKAAELEEQKVRVKEQADKYHLKMSKGSEHFPDFQEMLGDFEPDKFPNTALLAADFDNTPEIMYELSRNPAKLIEIEALSKTLPRMAMRQLKILSDSIVKNLDAKAENVTTEPPLSRIKPSTAGADNGKMTLNDFKKVDWLRG